MTNANTVLKICAMYNSIKGKQSFFVDTRGATGSGKTFEDKQVLSCFDSSDIIQVNDMTYESLFGEEYKFDKKIIFLGDMNANHFKGMKKVFNVFKTLMINHEYSRITCKKEQILTVKSLCVMYETIKSINSDEHILSHSLQFTTKLSQNELLDRSIESFKKTDERCEELNEEEKMLNYYREQIKKCRKLNIKVQHDFKELFDSEISGQFYINDPTHKLEQLLLLFESYVELNSSIDSDCVIKATKEHYNNFISLVHECSFMEDSGTVDFVKMLKTRIKAVNLSDLVNHDFNKHLEDITNYDKLALHLIRHYGLNSKSKKYCGVDYFFTSNLIRDYFRSYPAFENVDDYKRLLKELVSQNILGVVGKYHNHDVYYLKK